MTRADIGETLAAIRRSKGLTQQELATLLGTSQARVSQMERHGPGNINTMLNIAKVCGVDMRLSWSSRWRSKSTIDPRVRALLYY